MSTHPSIAELERAVARSASVAVSHLVVPPGELGAEIVEPLTRRIDELTAALDPDAPLSAGYRPRRVVLALRNALAVALARVAETGGTVDERFDRYLGPTPPTLFAGNDDFSFSFFSGLQAARSLFQALPEERVARWIADWRASTRSRHLDERIRRVLTGKRRRLLAGAPSPEAALEAAAAATGLACTAAIYALTPVARGSSLSRVHARPRGLSDDRWPRDGARKMSCVLVLDLAEIPELASVHPGSRVLCLFVDRPRDGFDRCAVITLDERECAAGFVGGSGFEARRVMVPPEVFDAAAKGAALAELRAALRSLPGRALGRPLFLQQDATPNDGQGFVLEASAAFARLNLGDNGRLFVYEHDAFWESC